jgi:serine phosphatase RsbU (regulator of sigma subunit)
MRRLLIPLLLAVIGYGALALLFPRFAPAARWGQTLDRAEAIARAAEIAARLGIETSGWQTVVVTRRNRENERYLNTCPQSAATALLSPLYTEVSFVEPGRQRSVTLSLATDGRLDSLTRREPETENKTEDAALPESRIAAALQELSGNESARFSPLASGASEKGARTYTQQYLTSDADPVKFIASATTQNGVIKELTLKAEMSQAFRQQLSGGRVAARATLTLTMVLLLALAAPGALIFFFFGIARKQIEWRSALVFFAVVWLLIIIANALGGTLEDLRRDFLAGGSQGSLASLVFPALLFALITTPLALLALIVWSGGLPLALRKQARQSALLLNLLKGRALTRPAGLHLAVGLLLGGVLAALPFLIAANGIFGRLRVDDDNIHRNLAASAPAIAALASPAALNSSTTFFLFILFAFIVPLLDAYVRRPVAVRVLSGLVGLALLGAGSDFRPPNAAASALTGLLLMIVSEQIYRRFDLFTLLVAGMTSEITIRAAALLAQPGGSLRASGMIALLALGALLLLALIIARKGRAYSLEEEAARLQARTQIEDKAERERLKAEFSVAQRAQQQMLPASTPALPGFSIAALCRPSREVGGDLYDFIPMSEGRLGIVVADVSGKGVPASLYMTLTRGLMLSVAEDRSDPGEILREVNRHLYEVCRHKTFVTLFFGVLDPQQRTMTYARAGHNPPVWRQATQQAITMLKPPGPGLGLTAGKSFDRVLKVEQISLAPHDTLFLYSDGITEAMNEHQEEYGEERLKMIAARADGLDAESALSTVLGDVSAFLAGTPPQDDQTLVVVRVSGN